MTNASTSTAPTLRDLGQALYQAGEYAPAAARFAEAAEQYRSDGDLLSAAEMENNRSVSLLQTGDASGALQAAQGTETVFAEAGDLRRQGMALGNQAAALDELKQYDQALDLYHQSSAIFQQSGDRDLRSIVLEKISAIHLKQKRTMQAVGSMQDALDSKEKLGFKDKILSGLLKTVDRLLKRS